MDELVAAMEDLKAAVQGAEGELANFREAMKKVREVVKKKENECKEMEVIVQAVKDLDVFAGAVKKHKNLREREKDGKAKSGM